MILIKILTSIIVSDQHFFFKYVLKNAHVRKIVRKIVKMFWTLHTWKN